MPQENSDMQGSGAMVVAPSDKIASAENGAGSSKPRPNLLERLGYIAKHLVPDALEALPVVGPALLYGRKQEGRDNLYAGIGQGFDRLGRKLANLGRKSANIVQDSAEVVLRGVGATVAASYLQRQRLDSANTRKTDNRIQDGVDATARFGATALRSAGRILKWGALGSLALASLPIVVPVAAAAATAYGTVKLGRLAFKGAMALATGATELYKNTQEKWQDDQRARTLDARKKQLKNDRDTIDAANERITRTQQAIVDISQQDIAASFEKMLKKSPEEQDEIWLKISGRIDTPEEMQSLLHVIDDNPEYEALYNQLNQRNSLPRLNPSAEAAPEKEKEKEKENISFGHLPDVKRFNDLISSKNPALGQQGSGTLKTPPLVTGYGPVDMVALLRNQQSGRDAGS